MPDYSHDERALLDFIAEYKDSTFDKMPLSFLERGIEICSKLKGDRRAFPDEVAEKFAWIEADDGYHFAGKDGVPRFSRVARVLKVWLQIDIEHGNYRKEDGGDW
jgi:hypothetical protein